ncbi:hypothetical protein SVIO_056340 [Streptomyces violaceusniger]|uniref:Uncharacterized protein n=1 Tax=Streptomyces violaceusniger TaxID=68280 RepID=A0A4D4L0A6_STRVO|nr:hypothetical protein SVIO_056340 [Streptomyces violaceusniger]
MRGTGDGRARDPQRGGAVTVRQPDPGGRAAAGDPDDLAQGLGGALGEAALGPVLLEARTGALDGGGPPGRPDGPRPVAAGRRAPGRAVAVPEAAMEAAMTVVRASREALRRSVDKRTAGLLGEGG